MNTNSFDWDGATLQARSSEWILDLENEIAESTMHRLLRENAGDWQHWTEGRCPEALRSLVVRTKELVLRQTGVALLKCGVQRTSNEARALQLIFGCEFGSNITRTPESDDRPLFALQAMQDPTASGKYSGNGLNGNPIGFHSDGSGSTDRSVDVLALLCLCPARFGGQSRVSNAQLAYKSLPAATRTILESPFPRENPFAPESSLAALKVAPIFCEVERHGISYLNFSYHPQRVRNGISADPERCGSALDSLQLLDEALELFSCDINLMRNEILLVNNSALAHDRRAFMDDPQAKRLLERFWAGTLNNAAVTGEQ